MTTQTSNYRVLLAEDEESLSAMLKLNLELDGYSDKLKIAFEHQGRQHFEVDGFFNKTRADLILRKKLDKHKKYICKQRGIFLFEVPEIGYALKIEDLPNFHLKQAKENSVERTRRLEIQSFLVIVRMLLCQSIKSH